MSFSERTLSNAALIQDQMRSSTATREFCGYIMARSMGTPSLVSLPIVSTLEPLPQDSLVHQALPRTSLYSIPTVVLLQHLNNAITVPTRVILGKLEILQHGTTILGVHPRQVSMVQIMGRRTLHGETQWVATEETCREPGSTTIMPTMTWAKRMETLVGVVTELPSEWLCTPYVPTGPS